MHAHTCVLMFIFMFLKCVFMFIFIFLKCVFMFIFMFLCVCVYVCVFEYVCVLARKFSPSLSHTYEIRIQKHTLI